MDIGIDLGTTYSVLAVPGKVALNPGYPPGEYIEESDVTLISAPDGNATFPSVLMQHPDDPDAVIIGADAKQSAEMGEAPLMWTKRNIGTTEKFVLGKQVLTAKDAAREMLSHFKQCAEAALGKKIERAVITHPAYFTRNQVEETRQAAVEAGFDMSLPEQMLMEPIAAALAYIPNDDRDPLRIMIYDLGGGTFDVTILERRAGTVNFVAWDGDHLLGGVNFDRKLAQWVLDRLKASNREVPYDETNPEHRARRAQFLQWAEGRKESLADRGHRTKIDIQLSCNMLVDADGRTVQVRERINQETFTTLIADELEKTIDCCRSCLSKADMTADQLDYILLVGGSTHGPWIERAVEKGFDIEPIQFEPDRCVAIGAAIRSLSLPQKFVTDDFDVELDVPATSGRQTIAIYGSVTARHEQRSDPYYVTLRTNAGDTMGPLRVGDNGGFGFDDVKLRPDMPTQMAMRLTGADMAMLWQKEIRVTYTGEEDDITTISTVLPKSLAVKTSSGFLTFAEEGIDLPSPEITFSVVRLFDAPNEVVDIYQQHDKVGTVELDDIPAIAGEGAEVAFCVRVTKKNELVGTANVLDKNGESVRQGPVQVSFPPVDVANIPTLEADFRRLQDEHANQLELAKNLERKTILLATGGRLLNQIQEKLAEQDPNAQEIERLVRELDRLLHPIEKEMDPPVEQFNALLAACRSLILAQGNNPEIENFKGLIAQSKAEGETARNDNDIRKWRAVYDSIASVYHTLRNSIEDIDDPQRQVELPETARQKDRALMDIDKERARLGEARQMRLRDTPEIFEAVWRQKIETVAAILDAMEKQVNDIDDHTDKGQAQALIDLAKRRFEQAKMDIDNIRKGVTLARA